MPRLSATFDLKPLETHMRGVPRLVRKHTRQRLSYWGRRHVADIRKHNSVFKYREGGATGKLIASMWTRRAKSGGSKQLIGWGVPYGEVMEFGPRRKFVWDIFPTGFRSDITHGRSGGGVALKMLQFQWHGKICYAKKVTHRWTTKELRPHVGPSLDRLNREFMIDMGSIPQRVIEGELA